MRFQQRRLAADGQVATDIERQRQRLGGQRRHGRPGHYPPAELSNCRAPYRAGKLKIVLSEYESPPVPVHILHREGRHSSAKIRSFVDLMAERLRAELSLN